MTAPDPQHAADEARVRAFKVYENRLRRVAARQGLTLRASRRRDPRAVDYGTYLVVDASNVAVAQGLDHDAVADYLGEPRWADPYAEPLARLRDAGTSS